MQKKRVGPLKIISRVEIAFWDTTIALMSREKMPRVYSQTLAALTLRLQPAIPHIALKHPRVIISLPQNRWIRLALIAAAGLLLGVLLGWLGSS
jgi:hypothetical protein